MVNYPAVSQTAYAVKELQVGPHLTAGTSVSTNIWHLNQRKESRERDVPEFSWWNIKIRHKKMSIYKSKMKGFSPTLWATVFMNNSLKTRFYFSNFSYHLLQMLLLADVHHDQTLFDQAEADVILGVSKLYCDVWAGGTWILHIHQALGVLDVPHNAVNHICTGILLKKQEDKDSLIRKARTYIKKYYLFTKSQ